MSLSETLDRAVELLRSGRSVEAEALVVDAAREAQRRHGTDSRAFADAQGDVAQILVGVGDLARAAAALRVACEVPAGDDEQGKRDRLTMLMNLGDVLVRIGELDEAERVLRDGLAGRAQFYGPDHPGYAYGLEPLADALLHSDRAAEALPLAAEAVKILWNNGHKRTADVLPLRAFATKAVHGADVAGFDGIEALPEDLFDQAITASLERAQRSDPSVALMVLGELRTRVEARADADTPWLLHIDATISNVAREAGDHDARQGAFELLQAALDRQGDAHPALDATLGLAMARGDAGAIDAAIRSYEDAERRAEAIGDPALRSNVARNFGLFLSEQEQNEKAEARLRTAMQLARQADAPRMLGRSLVAYGIFVQHRGRLDEARQMLSEALAVLPADEPDTLYARSHLQAIETGGSCGCGDMQGALGEAVTAMVREQLPDGLLQDVSIALDENGAPDVQVQLARKPTDKEMQLLDTVVNQAIVRLQQQIRSSGHSR